MAQGERRILGIDYGLERTGIALAINDVVLPLTALTLAACHTRKNLLDKIAALAAEKAVHAIVMGMPLLEDGSETEMSAIVRNAAAKIARRLPGCPLHFMPELLSTHEASLQLQETGLKGQKLKAALDQAAACRILSSFLAHPPDRSSP